jgi:hypothetical protein
MLRHAGRSPDVAADDLAGEELQVFAQQRRSAVLLQATATVVGVFLSLLAVVFYLALAIFTSSTRSGSCATAHVAGQR